MQDSGPGGAPRKGIGSGDAPLVRPFLFQKLARRLVQRDEDAHRRHAQDGARADDVAQRGAREQPARQVACFGRPDFLTDGRARGFEPQLEVACLLEVERPVVVGVETLEDCLVLVAGYLADECHLHLFEAEHAVLVRVLRRRDMVLIRGYC